MISVDKLKISGHGTIETVYQVREYENNLERLKGNIKILKEFKRKKDAEIFAKNIITKNMPYMEILKRLNKHDYEMPKFGEIVLNDLFNECDYIELIGYGLTLELGLREAPQNARTVEPR